MSIVANPGGSSAEEPTEIYPIHGDAQPCRGCGAPVARDQRYCLGCGERSPNGKVPFAQTLAPEPAAPAAAATAAGRGGVGPGLAAAIVCLAVLFLGTGVLVGRSGSSGGGQVAAAPQAVTTVEQGATDGGDAAATGASKKSAGKKAAAKDGGAAKAAAPPIVTGAKKAALDKAVSCKTTAECQEASKKIPNEFTTPGTPPPVDGKAPAGGAQGQTFN